jgi:hypothetical protein
VQSPVGGTGVQFQLKTRDEVSIQMDGGHQMAQPEVSGPSSIPKKHGGQVSVPQVPRAPERSSGRIVYPLLAGRYLCPQAVQVRESLWPLLPCPRGTQLLSLCVHRSPETAPLWGWQPTADVKRSLLANLAKGVGSRSTHICRSGRRHPTVSYWDNVGPHPSPGHPKWN